MATDDEVYDVIVIGAGVEGSATAYYLTSRYTNNVLLLEQFSVGHTRGSSHGGSRITRKAYLQPYYVKMMDEAFDLWSEIEKKSQQQIYRKTGILVFGGDTIKSYIRSLEQNDTPHTVMTGREANNRYPNQLKLPEDYMCVTEDTGGILKANKAVSVLQSLFVQNGGRFLDQTKVMNIIPNGSIVSIETNVGKTFRTNKLIITAGAWANKVLEPTGLQLPLKVIRTEVLYWPVDNEQLFTPDAFPVFFVETNTKQFYGLPIQEYPGLLKVCYHDGPAVDPDRRDISPNSHSCDDVTDFISSHFKGVSTKPAIMETCMYTVTKSEDPFLDVHPKYANIIIGAGFSGHGFKLAPVVGKILSELALDKQLSYDLSPFRIEVPKIYSSL